MNSEKQKTRNSTNPYGPTEAYVNGTVGERRGQGSALGDLRMQADGKASGKASMAMTQISSSLVNAPREVNLPASGPTFGSNNDSLLAKLKEQEEGKGQVQMTSGGFGDSTNIDEEQVRAMLQRTKDLQLQQQQLSINWDPDNFTEDYKMESNMFDYEQIKQSEFFSMKKYQDSFYRGEVNDHGQREGYGVMVYRKNRVYEGQWLCDLRHGKGYERYSNGNTYEGNFANGKAEGKGVYHWANGEVYDGEWHQGVKEGYGMWKGIYGDSYMGQWSKSKAHGHGVHQWKNGDRYEGSWYNCLKHGKGTDIFANGDSFSGEYLNGRPEGKGVYKWKNGSIYSGDFKDGMKHGKGEWRKVANNPKCNKFEGEYRFDKKNGTGTFTWESGNIYHGNYINDERMGYGEMYWTDGSVYKGEWYKGIQHGKGIMTFPDGRIKDGLFENNVFKGSVPTDYTKEKAIEAFYAKNGAPDE